MSDFKCLCSKGFQRAVVSAGIREKSVLPNSSRKNITLHYLQLKSYSPPYPQKGGGGATRAVADKSRKYRQKLVSWFITISLILTSKNLIYFCCVVPLVRRTLDSLIWQTLLGLPVLPVKTLAHDSAPFLHIIEYTQMLLFTFQT